MATLPEIPGVHRVRAKLAGGRRVRYHYAYRGGPRFWTEPDDGDDPIRYTDAYKSATSHVSATPGSTIETVVKAFFDSGDFKRLSKSSQRAYRTYGESFAVRFRTAPVTLLEDRRFRAYAIAWRDQWSDSPRAAQYAWSVAKRIASWAHDRGTIGPHVITGGAALYKSNRAELVWTSADIAAFNAAAPPAARRLLAVALSTGLRAGDLARLSWSHIVEGRAVQIRTSKKQRVATIPILAEMRAVLDDTPRDRMLILLNERGRPLTAESASKTIRRWATRAGVNPDLHLHDCRGTAATRLVREGVAFDRVAICMGWSIKYAVEVVANYVALDPAGADAVIELLEREKKKPAGQ